jgi:hypothetical protein
MRKAIEAFESEFAQWGLTLPARDIVDRQPGHSERHGWSLDYSFGSDAFGEYLEYHARRTVPNEPVVERHARVYANGEKNFVPAPAAELPDQPFIQPEPAPKATGGTTRRATLPPFASMVEESTGSPHRPSAATAKRPAPAPSARPAPRPAASDHGTGTRRRPSSWRRNRHTALSFAIGVGAALLVAIALVTTVKIVRAHRAPSAVALADTAELEPIVVLAPAVLGFSTETPRFTQPLVGRPADPNRAEIVRPERGMTPIIPSDPGTKKAGRPAPTTRGEKFHVP